MQCMQHSVAARELIYGADSLVMMWTADYPPTLQEVENEAESSMLRGAAGPKSGLFADSGRAVVGQSVSHLVTRITSVQLL